MNVPDTKSLSDRIGATPQKIGLVVVMAVILMISVVVNFGSGEPDFSDSSVRVARAPKLPRSVNRSVVTETKEVAHVRPQVEWPQIDMETVTQYDPFAPPAFMQPPPPKKVEKPKPVKVEPIPVKPSPEEIAEKRKAEALQQTRANLQSLKTLGVEMVISTSEGTVARIGNQMVRVGDTVDGLRVIAIDASGITVVSEADYKERFHDN